MRIPWILRLCRSHGISQIELASLLVEILANLRERFQEGRPYHLVVTGFLSRPSDVEAFFSAVRDTVAGLVAIHRRNALRACAKRQAALLDVALPKDRVPSTRGRSLKLSIQSKLPILLICAIAIIAGIVLALSFL